MTFDVFFHFILHDTNIFSYCKPVFDGSLYVIHPHLLMVAANSEGICRFLLLTSVLIVNCSFTSFIEDVLEECVIDESGGLPYHRTELVYWMIIQISDGLVLQSSSYCLSTIYHRVHLYTCLGYVSLACTFKLVLTVLVMPSVKSADRGRLGLRLAGRPHYGHVWPKHELCGNRRTCIRSQPRSNALVWTRRSLNCGSREKRKQRIEKDREREEIPRGGLFRVAPKAKHIGGERGGKIIENRKRKG